MTKVGVLHENAQISRRFWRKLISLMSISANYTNRDCFDNTTIQSYSFTDHQWLYIVLVQTEVNT